MVHQMRFFPALCSHATFEWSQRGHLQFGWKPDGTKSYNSSLVSSTSESLQNYIWVTSTKDSAADVMVTLLHVKRQWTMTAKKTLRSSNRE